MATVAIDPGELREAAVGSHSVSTGPFDTVTVGPLPVGASARPSSGAEHRPVHRAVLGAVGPVHGSHLLDVGCGVGLLLRSAESRGALVAGVDTATELLEIARWALPDADLRLGDGAALPFGDAAFDVITACTAVPAGGTGRSAVFAELARVVRPGGRVAVGGWVHPAGCWTTDLDRRIEELAPAARPNGSGSAAELEADLRAAGFSVLGTGEVGCPTGYRDRAAAWAAVLGGERLLTAIAEVGVRAVHDAFLAAVSPEVAADGSVRLARVFRYAVATVPERFCYAV